MNNTPAQATALIEAVKPLVAAAAQGPTCDVAVGVPFIDIPAALEAV
ncbi:MAG: triose-phosphate isomerase, partial [Oscillospiraceae bacterium]|nr:triose-phosphate isomerase [Oscillospiraceae bacterium]